MYINSTFNSENLHPVSVEQVLAPEENSFIIYPNPAKGNLNIKINEPGEYQIILRDINGREIATKKINNSSSTNVIDISNYSSGFYLITATNNNFTSTKKFIIH